MVPSPSLAKAVAPNGGEARRHGDDQGSMAKQNQIYAFQGHHIRRRPANASSYSTQTTQSLLLPLNVASMVLFVMLPKRELDQDEQSARGSGTPATNCTRNLPAMLDNRWRLSEAHHRLALLDGHVVALPRADVHLHGRRVDGSAGRAQQHGSHGIPSPAWDARSSRRPPAASSAASGPATRRPAERRTILGKSPSGNLRRPQLNKLLRIEASGRNALPMAR